CRRWAMAGLGAGAVAQGDGAGRKDRPTRSRPRVGRHPMLWKEVFAEPGLAFNRFGKVLVALIILASFIPAVWIAVRIWLDYEAMWGFRTATYLPNFWEHFWAKLGEGINQWVRMVGTLVACLTLLSVAARAASSVSGERERQTFDSLLTTPLEGQTILFAKWLGSLLSVRWAWAWLCLIWVLGLLTSGLDHTTLPWLVLAWLVYAAFMAA